LKIISNNIILDSFIVGPESKVWNRENYFLDA
jgi:hypothetical protein